MHLRADIFVSAYLRRCGVEGAFAALRRRGSPEAGAIFVKVDCLDGRTALYGPAPQTELADRDGIDRLWMRLHKDEWIASADAEARITKEISFDPDLWLVEVEDAKGRSFLDLAD
jgi:hypothetical protein